MTFLYMAYFLLETYYHCYHVTIFLLPWQNTCNTHADCPSNVMKCEYYCDFRSYRHRGRPEAGSKSLFIKNKLFGNSNGVQLSDFRGNPYRPRVRYTDYWQCCVRVQIVKSESESESESSPPSPSQSQSLIPRVRVKKISSPSPGT